MTKVKTFFRVLQSSFLPNHHYYPHILRAPFFFSLKYFVSLIIAVNFVFFAALSGTINPQNILALRAAVEKSFMEYPHDLIIEVNKGIMHANADKPYLWWLDYKDKKILMTVVDENATPSLINSYNSYVLLTADRMVFNTKKLPFTRPTKPYEKNVYLDKAIVMQMGQQVDDKLQKLYMFFIPIVFIGFPLVVSFFFLLYLFLLSLVAHPLYLLFSRHGAPFLKTFQIALHAATLPIIVYYAVHYFRVSGEAIPLMPLVFVNLVVIFILGGLHEAHFKDKRAKASS